MERIEHHWESQGVHLIWPLIKNQSHHPYVGEPDCMRDVGSGHVEKFTLILLVRIFNTWSLFGKSAGSSWILSFFLLEFLNGWTLSFYFEAFLFFWWNGSRLSFFSDVRLYFFLLLTKTNVSLPIQAFLFSEAMLYFFF